MRLFFVLLIIVQAFCCTVLGQVICSLQAELILCSEYRRLIYSRSFLNPVFLGVLKRPSKLYVSLTAVEAGASLGLQNRKPELESGDPGWAAGGLCDPREALGFRVPSWAALRRVSVFTGRSRDSSEQPKSRL